MLHYDTAENYFRNPETYFWEKEKTTGREIFGQLQTTEGKFRLKLKKVGKTARPFRYDLNQIPYDYTMEVSNRFKGLDLIDSMPDELWMEVRDIV